MTFQHRMLAALALLAGLAGAALPGGARAAQSYDSCTGFIDSLPATISTQGTWCLRGHLSTAITDGNAITIAANNVTLDCNEFRVGGLAAGNASNARGILANRRQNVTVRNCNVRGFDRGISISGGAGHLVENNRLDNNLSIGIHIVDTDNGLVQRNRVYDTGGKLEEPSAYGIYGFVNIIDNTVSGLFADAPMGVLTGIYLRETDGAQIRDNSVSGFDMSAPVYRAYGIRTTGSIQARISGNQVVGGLDNDISGSGIEVPLDEPSSYCLDNTVGGFMTNIVSSCNSSGNLISP